MQQKWSTEEQKKTCTELLICSLAQSQWAQIVFPSILFIMPPTLLFCDSLRLPLSLITVMVLSYSFDGGGESVAMTTEYRVNPNQ